MLSFPEASLEEFPSLGQDWLNVSDPNWDDQMVDFWNTQGIEPGFEATEASDSIAWVSDLSDSTGVFDTDLDSSWDAFWNDLGF